MTDFREGVFFDLSAEEYHSVEALSASGMKHLRVSPLDYWARSTLNPARAEVLAEEIPSEAKDLGTAFHVRICEGKDRFDSRYAAKIAPEEFPDCLRTMDDLKAWLKERDLKVSGSKDDLIARVHEADPNAKIWDHFLATHEAAHDGKSFLTQKWLDKIEIAAAMIERHPHLSKAFTGGAPEVSIFWRCPEMGIPCKARLDYLKARAIVDLKTLAPQQGVPLPRAIATEFGRRRYFVQAAFYAEAAGFVAKFIKDGLGDLKYEIECGKALAADHPKTFLFVFQVKGPAPVAIGRIFPAQSMIFQAAKTEIDTLKMTYKTYWDKYGADPWVSPDKIEAFQDDDVPPWSLA